MLRMTRRARPRAAAVIAATLALTTAGTLTTTTLAHANPQTDLASEQQKAAELEAQIEANGNRVSILDEQYTKTQLAIETATDQINADEQALAAKRSQTEAVRAQLQERAAELYMGAGNPCAARVARRDQHARARVTHRVRGRGRRQGPPAPR